MHFDENAERNVIAAICTTAHAKQIFRELVGEDFFGGKTRKQYEWLYAAYSSGTLTEAISQATAKGISPPDLPLPVFDAVNAVRNHAIRRKMEQATESVCELCRDYSVSASDVQTKFREMAVDCIDSRVCKVPSQTLDDVRMFIDEFRNDDRAFLTGLPEIDRKAAVQPRDFVILGARPGVGKSAIAAGFLLANFMGKERHRGIFFSMEMDRKQTYARLVSMLSGIQLLKFINPTQYKLTDGDAGALSETLLKIKENFPAAWFQAGQASLDDIRHTVELERPEFIVIDYVQIIKHFSKHGTTQKLEEVSIALRQIAMEMNIAVVALAQLNRDADCSSPTISQIKGSGQFEQDATHIWLLDRPESEQNKKSAKRNYYTRDGREVDIVANDGRTLNRAALVVGKNRNGPCFYELLNFDPNTTAFTPYE